MRGTIAEKILSSAAGRRAVAPGDIVVARPDVALSHESSRLAIAAFRELGAKKVSDPEKIFIILDHRVPAECEETALVHGLVREFVKSQKIRNFFDAGEGVCHQVVAEKGYARPGALIVGADSHTTTAGALGAFATGIGATELAAVWANGELWLKVPHSISIEILGRPGRGVHPKDIALHLCGTLGADGADYKCIEYRGSAVARMGIGGRMTLCNMAAEMGAKAAVVEPDGMTRDFLSGRPGPRGNAAKADRGAEYEFSISVDVSGLAPQVACPHSPGNTVKVTDIEGIPVDQAVIGSCTNGRLEDLHDAVGVIGNRRVHPGVRLIVVPASREILLSAIRDGTMEKLVAAGAMVENPGCGPCLGAHQGVLAPGETCISTTNRNFRGRMGSSGAGIYLASAATVAASALRGKITDPRRRSR